MILGSIGVPQDNHRQYITDGVNLTVNKVNVITDTRSILTGFHELLYPECHHLTRKHVILGLNHLNGQTPVNPRLMHPLQYMDPEYHHTMYKRLSINLNYSKEWPITGLTYPLRHNAQERHQHLDANSIICVAYELETPVYHHHTYCNLFHHLLIKYKAPECHNTVGNLLFKYETPEYHNTVCSIIHHLLFKHDTPEYHLTMGSLIHHLHE
jgi:hypothetical protein